MQKKMVQLTFNYIGLKYKISNRYGIVHRHTQHKGNIRLLLIIYNHYLQMMFWSS